MYTIIGGDGKEYGPVPADQIRAWIAAGRAGLETQVKRLGADEWRRLGDIPEFTGGAEEPPVPDPSAPPLRDAEAISALLIERAGKLDISSCYERSWHLLKADFWPLVGVTSLIYGIELALAYAPLSIFFSVILSGSLKGGLSFYYLRKIRGQSATLRDAFAGFTAAFLPLVIASLAVSAFTLVGLVLVILPGVYLAVAYLFAFLLILDRKMDFWTAMEVSRRVVTAQWWRIFGLVLLALLFALLGLSILLVGILAALPLIGGAIVYAYEDLFSTRVSSAAP